MARLRKDSPIPEKGKGSKLNPKQTAFVDEFFVDMNATAAAERAGYSGNNINRTATELLNHPLVIKEINSRMAERRERLEFSADYVIQKLINIVENTEEGNPQAALRGLELLGKHLGLYRDRQEISGPDGGAIEYEQKMKEDNLALESAITRLTSRTGTGSVVEFPDSGTTV